MKSSSATDKKALKMQMSDRNLNVRHGVVATKIGMTSFWQEDRYIPVTLLAINNIVKEKFDDTDKGYKAIALAYGHAIKITKPTAGNLGLIKGKNAQAADLPEADSVAQKNKISKDQFIQHTGQDALPQEWKDLQHKKVAFSKTKEFRTNILDQVEVGAQIFASHFKVGQLVDVAGISIGKGFAGGMKRHNFRGLEASHGVSISHRSSGSTGQNQDPGRTFPGKKMPGHMGAVRRTVENLKVLGHYGDNNEILVVTGSVPGYNGCYLEVRDAIKAN